MEVPMTFADFAVTEVRFRKQFRLAPRDTWNENMVPLVEFLDMERDDREGNFPFVWSVNSKNELTRLLVAEPLVASCEDRRDFWTMLRALAGVGKEEVTREQVADEVRREVVGTITSGLLQLVGGAGAAAVPVTEATPSAAPADDGYMAPWIDTAECTACDECTNLNSKMFAYNADKKAFIKDANGGPYRDLVKAAERCTARVIHPGLPRDRGAKDVDKWIQRGEKFN
jgi:pyruvate-ferredoxin/flavodoxin oxidoreductase